MSFQPIFDRSGRVPRSAFILVLVLVVAAVALFFVSRRQEDNNLTLGGPLLPIEMENPAQAIDGFVLTRQGVQYRFDRDEEGFWTLRGGLTDDLSQAAVARFLEEITAAKGGRLLPGTEPDDRRYEFNGPAGLRLTVIMESGARHSLALGVANPVTGYFYASGAGRVGCFPVSEVVRIKLNGLPDAVRLKSLLPTFDRQVIHEVGLDYRSEPHLLKEMDGLWWLRKPGQDLGALGLLARSYHQQYNDRLKIEDEAM